MTDTPEQPRPRARAEEHRESPWLRLILDDADFQHLAVDRARWAGTPASTNTDVTPVGRRELSSRYSSWTYIYRFHDWASVVLARTYLEAYEARHEIIYDDPDQPGCYAILTDYFDPSCGTCPWRPSDNAITPPDDYRCHSKPRSCKQVYELNRAQLNQTHSPTPGDTQTAFPTVVAQADTREDGTPLANVLLEFLPDGHQLWWRQDDGTWTDGQKVEPWQTIETVGGLFAPFRPFDGARLLFTAIVDHDPVARSLLVRDIERWYDSRLVPDARQRALRMVTRLRPDEQPDRGDTAVLATVLSLAPTAVAAALATPSREPADQHLWEIEHPDHGSVTTVDDDTELASFDDLKEKLRRRIHSGGTVIYRWDWIDCHNPLLDGPDATDPGLDELQVHGLAVRDGHLFTYRCPVTKDQEPDVISWLRSPHMLGALQALWAPLLDPATTTSHTPEPRS